MDSKHYGIVDGIAQHEPDGATGNLSVSSVMPNSPLSPDSVVVLGSTTGSIDLAQLCLTAEQAIKLGSLLTSAGADALSADRKVEQLRKFASSATRLCFALAEADATDVLVDQSRVRLGYPREAQDIAERAYDEVAKSTQTNDDWRHVWRTAGERIQRGQVSP